MCSGQIDDASNCEMNMNPVANGRVAAGTGFVSAPVFDEFTRHDVAESPSRAVVGVERPDFLEVW
jgi:hypothetical protein